VGVSVIKWIVIALLVAGTFGFVWTAPWKDDVERLTGDVADRLGETFSTIGLRADNNTCEAATRPPDADERAAVDLVLNELRSNPDAQLANDGGDTTVRDIATERAHDIGGCLSKVTVRGKGWDDLKRRLDEGIARAR
jgi:hypothetical protein